MRIAQVAPLFESVPPKCYGGTERVVSYLTEELVRMGHDVTLFASGNSHTAAKLVSSCGESLRESRARPDSLIRHLLLIEKVMRQREEFDVIHFHVDVLHLGAARAGGIPAVTTLHGRLDLPELVPLFEEFRESPVISISIAQRRPLPWLNWVGNVYHGIPRDLYPAGEGKGGYLVFLGRVSSDKGLIAAIEIAGRAGCSLKIAAKIDAQDREYYRTVIEPVLKHSPHAEFLGEVNDTEKSKLLGDAAALLFPIEWPEPFGIVMIEALACGTPVIAFSAGSVPEVLRHPGAGFIVKDVGSAVAALSRIGCLDRKRCRSIFEKYYTVNSMTAGYLRAYRRVIGERRVDIRREEASSMPAFVRGADG